MSLCHEFSELICLFFGTIHEERFEHVDVFHHELCSGKFLFSDMDSTLLNYMRSRCIAIPIAYMGQFPQKLPHG